MKKVFAFISILAVAAASMFADISAKKLADGKVEVTFFYGNPRATEVTVAGDFTDWQNGALPMEKGDKGFTLVKVFNSDVESIKYKFISDGNWTTDLKAPDFVDDGFGGKNSFFDLTTVASATVASKGLQVGAWSHFAYGMEWDNNDDSSDLTNAGIGSRTTLALKGNATKNMPVFIELSLADMSGYNNLYKKDSLDWDEGVKHFVTDIFADPVEYMNGNAGGSGTYLGHFKIGLNTPYVNWTTGWKYAKLNMHQNVNWTTVSGNWDSGYNSTNSGFSEFDFRPAFDKLLNGKDVTAGVVVAPNRTANRGGGQYGLYSYGWVDSPYGYFDVQYNGAYGYTPETALGHVYEMDLIGGYKNKFGPVLLKANYLFNSYGDGDLSIEDHIKVVKNYYKPSSSDVGAVTPDPDSKLDNMAGNVNVSYGNDLVKTELGYRFRGAQASMMYVKQQDSDSEITDNLGDLNIQRIWADVKVTPVDTLSIGVNPYIEATLNKDAYSNHTFADDDNLLIFVKPYFEVKVTDTVSVDGYGKIKAVTEDACKFYRGSDDSKVILESAGLKVKLDADGDIYKGTEITYGFDNKNEKYLFNTVIADVKLANNFKAQAGFGIRTANKDVDDADRPFGFFLGVQKTLTVANKPTLWAQYLFAMDPYKGLGDGSTNYNMDDYVTDAGAENYAEKAGLRVGISWSF